MPTDLIARDWSNYLGKTLPRGFGEPEIARRSLEIFERQFAPNVPVPNADSARSVYALAMGDQEAAITYSQQALAAEPENPLFLKRAAATIQEDAARRDEAVLCLETAVEIAGPTSLYAAALVGLLWRTGDRTRALNTLNAACQAEFVLPEVLFMAARANRQVARDQETALHLMDRALADAPHVRRFMRFRVDCLLGCGKTEEAQEAVQEIARRFGPAKDLEI